MSEIALNNSVLNDIRCIIEEGRRQAYAAANQVAVLTYWHIGKRIVEGEQHGEVRAQYGTRLIKTLAEQLVPKYGNAFGKRNLEYFRQFYMCFNDLEIVNACVHNLTWTHFRAIIQVADPKAREWYAKEASEQMWSTRTLSRNIGTQYYGRRMASIREGHALPAPDIEANDLPTDPCRRGAVRYVCTDVRRPCKRRFRQSNNRHTALYRGRQSDG